MTHGIVAHHSINLLSMTGAFTSSMSRGLTEFARKGSEFPTEEEHRKSLARLRSDRAFLESLIDRCSEAMAASISGRYKLYCLTTHSSNALMWSHYAAGHSGICLEFSCRNSVFGGALKVEYRDTYPAFPLASDEFEDNISLLMTKARIWSYEDEYRLVAQDANVATGHDTLRTKSSFLKLPPDALTAVIMGCLIKSSDAAEIRAMFEAQVGRRVALKKIVRAPDHYDLSTEIVIA